MAARLGSFGTLIYTMLCASAAPLLVSASCDGWDNLAPRDAAEGGGASGGGHDPGGGTGGVGGATECVNADDCTVDVCAPRTCDGGRCGASLPAPKGTVCVEGESTLCDGAGTCVPWVSVSTTDAPAPRALHTSVWTGDRMIIWGGRAGPGQVLATGGRYDPVSDTWEPTSTVGAPAARHSHRAVWTGDKMIVWGGFGQAAYEPIGGIYDPMADSWSAMASTGQPSARTNHAMVWTGSEVLVWGGLINSTPLGNGAHYSPVTNSWAPVAAGGLSSRFNSAYVWAEPSTPNIPNGALVLWGGSDTFDWLGDGAMYNPVAKTWAAMSSGGGSPFKLESLSAHHASNGEVYMWGGWDGGNFYDDGYRFDPNAQPGGAWAVISDRGAPTPRIAHASLLPSSDVLFIWGGCGGMTCDAPYADGGVWRAGANGGTWTALPPSPLSARRDAAAVWTGSEAIVWGGRSGNTSLGDGARRRIAID